MADMSVNILSLRTFHRSEKIAKKKRRATPRDVCRKKPRRILLPMMLCRSMRRWSRRTEGQNFWLLDASAIAVSLG
jgi:hypothetical protein